MRHGQPFVYVVQAWMQWADVSFSPSLLSSGAPDDRTENPVTLRLLVTPQFRLWGTTTTMIDEIMDIWSNIFTSGGEKGKGEAAD